MKVSDIVDRFRGALQKEGLLDEEVEEAEASEAEEEGGAEAGEEVDLSYLDEMEYLDERDREILRAYAMGEDIPDDEGGEIAMLLAAVEPDVSNEEEVRELMGGLAIELETWNGSASRFTDEQYRRSCLIVNGPSKSDMHLPVREPSGKLNCRALQAAAGRLNQTSISPAQKKSAARKLISLYKQCPGDPPDSLKQMSEAVAESEAEDSTNVELSEDVVYQLPYEFSEPEKVGGKLWRKHLLPLDMTIKHGGNELSFSKDTLRDMILSFKDGAYDAVYAMVGHTNRADEGRGVLKNLFLKEDGSKEENGLYGDFELSPEGEKIIENNLGQIGTSVGYKPIRHREADGRTFKNALQHVAFTPTPAIPGLRPWEQIALEDAEETTVVDLTGPEGESHGPDQGKEESVSGEVETPTQEEKEVQELPDNVVSLEDFNELKNQLEELREKANAHDAAQATLRRQGIRRMLVDEYIAKGVPKSKCDVAFTLLSEDESLVTLSDEGDASIAQDSPKAKAVMELLEGYKGEVQFGEEGTSEGGDDEGLEFEERLDKRTHEVMREQKIDYPEAYEIALGEVSE